MYDVSSLRMADIIAIKRDGGSLSEQQIFRLIEGYTRNEIPDYQMAAWCMAVYLRGMSPEEIVFLTQAMIASGEEIDLSSIQGPLVDKHSTGGVGDKISLILAPMVAACGVKVPMMSGRALGHTGGTLDKLESIPGYKTLMTAEQFCKGIKKVGFSMAGQSEYMVPADRKLYALRDVIAAVESVPLISSSILSKKLAEGAQALVMDVKCGRGAFMKTVEEGRVLANMLVETGAKLGHKIIAVLSRMEEPLGRKVGNFLEVEETMDVLRGEGPADVRELTLRLGAWMLILGNIETDLSRAEERCAKALSDGSAMAKFQENIAFQGGDFAALEAMIGKARAAHFQEVKAQKNGYVTDINAFSLGSAGILLGVGRDMAKDLVNPLAGIELLKKTGEKVAKGEVILRLWSDNEASLDVVTNQLNGAVVVEASDPSAQKNIILEEITTT